MGDLFFGRPLQSSSLPALTSCGIISLILDKMPPAITARYDWILAITTIAFVFSAFGNGANDVANSYASMYTTAKLHSCMIPSRADCDNSFGGR